MNRRNFLSALGIGAATAAVAPSALTEAAPPAPVEPAYKPIPPVVHGQVIKAEVFNEIIDGVNRANRHATGGVVKPPLYAIGESGPEFVVIRPGSRIVLSSPTRQPITEEPA